MIAKPQILPGERFSWLVVERRIPFVERGRSRVVCRCDCGRLTVVDTGSLRRGRTKSCGCYRGGVEPGANRCHQPGSVNFANYGARGISVCERWRRSRANFVADMGPRPAGHTLDRIDNDGNYEPGNCRWATPSEQNANQRRAYRPPAVRTFHGEAP